MKNFVYTINCLVFVAIIHQKVFAQGNALDFDGINDRVELQMCPALNNNFTFEYWVYYKGSDPSFDRVLSSQSLGQLHFDSGGNTFLKYWYTSSDYSQGCFWVSTGFSMPLNQWTHLAWVNSGNGLLLYVNGILFHSNSSCNNNLLATLYSLGSASYNSQAGNIILDEFRIWNYGRSANEILNNYNHELVGNENGLVVYYNFNQGNPGANNSTINILYDQSAPALNGTLLNFALDENSSNWITSTAPIVPVPICSLTLSSPSSTSNQSHSCLIPITPITYNLTGTANATISGLPDGVTYNINSGVITLSGTPSETGTFNYTITPDAPCNTTTATGTITVNGGLIKNSNVCYSDISSALSMAQSGETIDVFTNIPSLNITVPQNVTVKLNSNAMWNNAHNITNHGTIEVNGGAFSNTNTGIYKGTGTFIGDFINEGIVNPGN